MPLNPEFKAKWLAALRSGKYKQGIGNLRRGDNYCCLGVACDIVDPRGWSPTEANNGYGDDEFDPLVFQFGGDPEITQMPSDPVKIAMGLEPNYGTPEHRAIVHLTELNDEQRKTFHEIADWIEENM